MLTPTQSYLMYTVVFHRIYHFNVLPIQSITDMKIISRLTISASSIVKLVMDKVVSLILELHVVILLRYFSKTIVLDV